MRSLARRLTVTLLLGGLAAWCVTLLNLLCLVGWGAFLWANHAEGGYRQTKRLAVQATLMAVVLAAACLWPGKTCDRLLDQPVRLGAAAYTLAELCDATTLPPRTKVELPVTVTWTFAPEDAEKSVAFAGAELSLRHFVAAIESQTSLRHRFVHCGNGWTLLRGGDCCFGLSLRDPELVEFGRGDRTLYEPHP
ncbi:MAG: hypothetical protein AAGB00_09220 [Planctomycetota bacterium]